MRPEIFRELYKKAKDGTISPKELQDFADEAMVCRNLGLKAEVCVHDLIKKLEGVLNASKAEKFQGDKG
jgi:hypothetical protein